MLTRMVDTDGHVILPWVSVPIAHGLQVYTLPDLCPWIVGRQEHWLLSRHNTFLSFVSPVMLRQKHRRGGRPSYHGAPMPFIEDLSCGFHFRKVNFTSVLATANQASPA